MHHFQETIIILPQNKQFILVKIRMKEVTYNNKRQAISVSLLIVFKSLPYPLYVPKYFTVLKISTQNT